jgi:hypothetical protein
MPGFSGGKGLGLRRIELGEGGFQRVEPRRARVRVVIDRLPQMPDDGRRFFISGVIPARW